MEVRAPNNDILNPVRSNIIEEPLINSKVENLQTKPLTLHDIIQEKEFRSDQMEEEKELNYTNDLNKEDDDGTESLHSNDSRSDNTEEMDAISEYSYHNNHIGPTMILSTLMPDAKNINTRTPKREGLTRQGTIILEHQQIVSRKLNRLPTLEEDVLSIALIQQLQDEEDKIIKEKMLMIN